MQIKTFTLPAGTICKRGGIPFVLMTATLIECHPENWLLIRDGFKPSVSVDGQALECSQSAHSLDKPQEAQAVFCSATTSNSSLLSSADDSIFAT